MGKMTPKDLKDLLKCIRSSPDVLIPPALGYDCGVHRIGKDRCVVVSTDPCINVPIEHFGWLLFHYTASDISVFGASPDFCAVELLGPPGTRPSLFKNIMMQFCRAANELGAAVITGHTGTYEGLETVLGVCTAYGTIRTRDLLTPGGARPGDLILCTKPIGLEVLTNLALRDRKLANTLFGKRRAHYFARQIRMQSCFWEARLLGRSGLVSAMHDITEGGLTASLNEMAEASNVGFVFNYESLNLLPELEAVSEYFELSRDQILSISSTGTLLAAIVPEHGKQILRKLDRLDIGSQIVGVFTENKKRLLRYKGREIKFPEASDDPYTKIVNADVR